MTPIRTRIAPCRRVVIALCTLSALAACSAADNYVNLRTIHQGQYCGDQAPSLRWLSREVLAETLRSASPGQYLDASANPLPVVDAEEKLLMISLGQKTSGGYGIALVNERAAVRDGVVELPLEIQQPAQGSMQTMQITHPCLVIALQGAPYQEVVANHNLGRITPRDSASSE